MCIEEVYVTLVAQESDITIERNRPLVFETLCRNFGDENINDETISGC